MTSIPPRDVEDASAITAKNAAEINEGKSDKKFTVLEAHGYSLGRTIGIGSYATVKVAQSKRHERDVAIKIVSKLQAPGDYLEKFLPREIEVVRGLKHPNLIRFLQAIETTHRVYIIMEYAKNGSLLDIIRRDTYIDENRSRKWFQQLAEAIHYCHDRGIVHRDVKCENLLMDNSFNIKLSDFGFAKGRMKPQNGEIPLSDTFCGSYAYASPEILQSIKYDPHSSDIWSMGVVLYAMVYGRLPFDDTNYTQLLKQVRSKVSFPKKPKVSPPCQSLINRILVPEKIRLNIISIKGDEWLKFPIEPVAGTSTFGETSKDKTNENTKGTSTDDNITIDLHLLHKILMRNEQKIENSTDNVDGNQSNDWSTSRVGSDTHNKQTENSDKDNNNQI